MPEKPLELIGKAQAYAWGKAGAASRISSLSGVSESTGPLAEYWIGTHSKGGSDVRFADGRLASLRELICRDPVSLLGATCVGLYGPDLPFLFKVLSINPAFGLSVQAHPDKARAARLHAEHPELYPDPNHKPEIGLPLTPVTLLYGFRDVVEIGSLFRRYPELQGILSAGTLSALLSVSPADGPHGQKLLRKLYRELLNASPLVIAMAVSSLCARAERDGLESEELRWLLALRKCYGDSDSGLLALFVMNIIRAEPGQGIFIAPNVPHAYLDGDLVECMACSDNVVRAGLTNKYKDIATLLEMVDYGTKRPTLISPVESTGGFLVFPVPAEEFEVSMLPYGSSQFELPALDSPQIIMSLGERCTVSGPVDGPAIEVGDGGAVLFPPGCVGYTVDRSKAVIFRATIGHGMENR